MKSVALRFTTSDFKIALKIIFFVQISFQVVVVSICGKIKAWSVKKDPLYIVCIFKIKCIRCKSGTYLVQRNNSMQPRWVIQSSDTSHIKSDAKKKFSNISGNYSCTIQIYCITAYKLDINETLFFSKIETLRVSKL